MAGLTRDLVITVVVLSLFAFGVSVTLNGCGKLYPLDDPRWCTHGERARYISDKRAYDQCVRNKSCVITAQEYAELQWAKRNYPQCFDSTAIER